MPQQKNGDQLSPKQLSDRWVRQIRKHARNWATQYQPVEDFTPLREVKERFYAFLLENDPVTVDTAFASAIYMPVCTWHILGRDVKKPLEDRGYIIVPNPTVDATDPFKNVRDVLMRQATEADDREYMLLERDLLAPLEDRVQRLINNGTGRLEQIKERRALLQTWAEQKSRGRRSRA